MIDAIVRPYAIAFLLAVLLVPLCRRLAFRLNLVAHPRDDGRIDRGCSVRWVKHSHFGSDRRESLHGGDVIIQAGIWKLRVERSGIDDVGRKHDRVL